jgi:hypothetical protein
MLAGYVQDKNVDGKKKTRKGASFALKRPWFVVSCALVRNREASRTRMECIGDDGTVVCWR